ncbi:hypothetical protein ABZS97_07555, partial [Streptomyces sp. NPDC005485]
GRPLRFRRFLHESVPGEFAQMIAGGSGVEIFVFVVVTLLVALGIAAAQGCQGPARGLGGDDVRKDVRQTQPDTRQGQGQQKG